MKMQKSSPVIKAGIWLDFKNAWIFTINGFEDPVMEKIESGVESRLRTAGDKEQVARFHTMIVGEKEKKQHRQHNQKMKYFKNIIDHIKLADYIYITGPGEAKEGLRTAIKESNIVRGQIAACDTAGKLTIKQMRQKMIEFFSDKTFLVVKELFDTLKN